MLKKPGLEDISSSSQTKKMPASQVCVEFNNLKKVLAPIFTKDVVDHLYEKQEKSYQPKIITENTLKQYFPEKKVKDILSGNTHFYDLIKLANYGIFDLEFADKLLILMKNKNITKTTRFVFESKESSEGISFGKYNLKFMTDKEYQDGVHLYQGEFKEDCASIGKSGSDLCIFDAFSSSSRTLLIRRDGKIIGKSPVFIDDTGEKILIASMVCVADADTKIIRYLTEELSIQLLTLNKNVKEITLGIGGANFITFGGRCFTRDKDNKPTEQYISLGNIRYEPDLNKLELSKEVEKCEQAIHLIIVKDKDYIKNKDVDIFMPDKNGTRKDFQNVAQIVHRNDLDKKMISIAKFKATLKETKGPNTAKLQKENEIQRFANAEDFKISLVKLLQKMGYDNNSFEISRANTAFTISRISKIETSKLIETFSELSSGAIKIPQEMDDSLPIKFILPLGFFGKYPIGQNKEKFWKAFCDKVDEFSLASEINLNKVAGMLL